LNESTIAKPQLKEPVMPLDPIFGISILMSFVAFGLFAGLYLWPWLRGVGRNEALRVLIIPHMFRFVGLSFLETGVVSASLPASFAVPTAYGDLGAALLAMAAAFAFYARLSFAIALVWLFNIWGAFDLIFAFYNGIAGHLDPGALGAAYYIPTAIVPPLLVTHGLIFALLMSQKSEAAHRKNA
jgi:hypothetical protein